MFGIGVLLPLAGGGVLSERAFGAGLVAGSGFGILFGLFAAFRLRAIEMTFVIRTDTGRFLSRLTMQLAAVGYHPERVVDEIRIFRPTLAAAVGAGRITVAVDGRDATVIGPSAPVREVVSFLASEITLARTSLVR